MEGNEQQRSHRRGGREGRGRGIGYRDVLESCVVEKSRERTVREQGRKMLDRGQ